MNYSLLLGVIDKVHKSPSWLAILAINQIVLSTFPLWIWKNSPTGHKTNSLVSACSVSLENISLGFVGKDEHWKSMWKVLTVLNISTCMENEHQKDHGGRVKGGFRDLSTVMEPCKSQWNNIKEKENITFRKTKYPHMRDPCSVVEFCRLINMVCS